MYCHEEYKDENEENLTSHGGFEESKKRVLPNAHTSDTTKSKLLKLGEKEIKSESLTTNNCYITENDKSCDIIKSFVGNDTSSHSCPTSTTSKYWLNNKLLPKLQRWCCHDNIYSAQKSLLLVDMLLYQQQLQRLKQQHAKYLINVTMLFLLLSLL